MMMVLNCWALEPSPRIDFRVANPNHKYGPYNNPNDTFDSNPYNRNLPVETQYTQTSSVLNVDTFSLSSDDFPQFGGFIQTGMRLIGQTSGACS